MGRAACIRGIDAHVAKIPGGSEVIALRLFKSQCLPWICGPLHQDFRHRIVSAIHGRFYQAWEMKKFCNVGTLSLKMSLVSQPLYILPKSVHIWVLKYVDRRGNLIISRKLIRGEEMKLTSSRTHNKCDMAWRVKEISQSARRAIRLTWFTPSMWLQT